MPGPACGAIVLPLSPLVSVDAVRVVAGGSATVLSSAQYSVAAALDPARLSVSSDATGTGAVQVDATYGFGPAASDVPATIRLAIRQLVACWFGARGDGPSILPAGLPASVRALLAPFARPRLR